MGHLLLENRTRNIAKTAGEQSAQFGIPEFGNVVMDSGSDRVHAA
jgi:hypothetical protein